ncbi:TVP38/TMEM64 family protein [Rhodopseudomonas sp. RCAM05734]|uniref:TVP38/TMEM64 family protein n=1 Tax=Rhodopseudomonas sp. RCAM05734 TaxID=3457549 RepID=UPI00404496F9
MEQVVRWLEAWGTLDARAAAVLAGILVLAAFLPVPRTIIVLGAGAAFGLSALTVIVPATTLGCILAFLLARGLLRTWVEKQIGKRPSWQIVARAVDDEGWPIVALMRFWGPLPNSAQNYLFGLTGIGVLPYSLITLVFTLPQIAFYTYLGSSGRMLLDDLPLPFSKGLVALAALIAMSIIFLVARRVRMIVRDGRSVQISAR